MRNRSIDWLRTLSLDKVSVYPAACLERSDNPQFEDWLTEQRGLSGDGVEIDDTQFSGSSLRWNGQRRAPAPFDGIKMIYTRYACDVEDIVRVYENRDGRAIVFVKPRDCHPGPAENSGQESSTRVVADDSPSVAREIRDTHMKRPHVVILGAGASAAAFPCGDRLGRTLPLMNSLVEICGMREVLETRGMRWDRNFEEIYAELYKAGQHKDLLKELEEKI